MPKTYKHLFSQVTSWENLLLAYRRCRRRKQHKTVATEFDYDWEFELLRLQKDLLRGNYRPGPYHNFYIFEPKRRKISAAPFRDRVVHHALVNVIEPIFERRFVFDSYACRRGKGTHRAIRRTQHFMRRFRYCLKTDVVRFFPNIDHQVLQSQLTRHIADERLLAVIDRVLESGADVLADEATRSYFPGDDLFAITRPCGLPIGNLTSQFFANVVLDQADHFVKEELRVRGYVRYADDLLLFGDDKQTLWERHAQLTHFLLGLRLRLHEHKTILRRCDQGISYLGFLVTPHARRLTQDALRRFNRRLRQMRWQYRHGDVDAEALQRSLKAWLAHANFGNSVGVRHAVWKRVRFQRRSKKRR